MPDALPTATLPLYPGLGQAPNMLACILSGTVIHSVLKFVYGLTDLRFFICLDIRCFTIVPSQSLSMAMKKLNLTQ